jgi:hypothetical protein
VVRLAEKNKKTYKIKFDSEINERTLVIPGTRIEYEKGKRVARRLFKDIVLKANEPVEIPADVYEILRKEKRILTKKEKEEIDKLRERLLSVRSGRAEPKGEPQLFDDETKKKLYGTKPYVVE